MNFPTDEYDHWNTYYVALSLLYHRAHFYLVQSMFILIIWCTTHISCCYMYTAIWTVYMTLLIGCRAHPLKLTIFYVSIRAKDRLKATWMSFLKTTWRNSTREIYLLYVTYE